MEVAFLSSRRVERHPYWQTYMTNIIACRSACACNLTNKCMLMKIFTHVIISRLVSFNSSGPKEYSLQSRLCLQNCLMSKKLKLLIEIFFLYKFRKSFVYFAKKQRLWGKGKPCPIKLNFFLVVLMTLENGIRFLLTCFEKLFYFGQFWDTIP